MCLGVHSELPAWMCSRHQLPASDKHRPRVMPELHLHSLQHSAQLGGVPPPPTSPHDSVALHVPVTVHVHNSLTDRHWALPRKSGSLRMAEASQTLQQ